MDENHIVALRKRIQEIHASVALKNETANLRILDVAPEVHEGAEPYFPNSKVLTLDIDAKWNPDFLCPLEDCPDLPTDYFDLIFCTEVLEHTSNPFHATETLFRALRPGGELHLTTPFNLRIHNPLPDNWRFTEGGLRTLLRSFTTVDVFPLETPDRPLMPIQYYVICSK